jgi:hypothetical protein
MSPRHRLTGAGPRRARELRAPPAEPDDLLREDALIVPKPPA